MCLSTVYEIKDGTQEKLAETVSGIKVDGGRVTLTDIMGIDTTVEGSIESIDLVKGVVLINPAV